MQVSVSLIPAEAQMSKPGKRADLKTTLEKELPLHTGGGATASGATNESKGTGSSASRHDKLWDAAGKVNAVPLRLRASEEEERERNSAYADREGEQIAGLWESTLKRSADIQFVIQKLMPSSDPGRTTSLMMRILATTIATAGQTGGYIFPMPGRIGMVGGSQLLISVLDQSKSKQARMAQVDQAQLIVLYKIVRDVADRLTENYRDYKKYVRRTGRAEARLEKMKRMILSSRPGHDDFRQIELDYLLDKAQEDVDEAIWDARRYRQSLVDLAGWDAVDRLDRQLTGSIETQPSGSETQLSGSETQPSGSDAQPSGSETQPSGSEAQHGR